MAIASVKLARTDTSKTEFRHKYGGMAHAARLGLAVGVERYWLHSSRSRPGLHCGSIRRW